MNNAEVVERYFRGKNAIIGYGNPKAAFWFVGIEDAGDPPTLSKMNAFKPLDASWYPMSFNNIKEETESGTDIYKYMSYIVGKCLGLPQGAPAEILCDNDGANRYFQINVFPLPRRRQEKWPDIYRELFRTIGKYRYCVRATQFDILGNRTRFEAIKKLWHDHSSTRRATICFGKTRWSDYTQALGLPDYGNQNVWHEMDGSKDILRLKNDSVFLTRFFNALGIGKREKLDPIIQAINSSL